MSAPEAEKTPLDIETPNDDADERDEQNFLENQHLYSWDAPGA